MGRRRVGKRGAAQRGRPPRPLLLAGALIAVVAGVTAIAWWRGVEDAGSVPPLPDLTGQTPAIRQHLEDRHRAATAAPDAVTIGTYCLALHADILLDAADGCYTEVQRLDPSAIREPYLQALIWSDRGGGERLLRALQAIVDRHPDFAPGWLRLGDAAFKAGNHDRAATAWSRAALLPEPGSDASSSPLHVVEAPLAAYATVGIARIALSRGDSAAAAGILEEVVANVPDFGPAWRLLGEAYTERGAAQAARAIRTADRLASFAPYADPFVDQLARESRNSTLLLRLASEASLGANAAWSEYLARRALEFDPDNPEAVSKLGRILRTLGRNAEALDFFRRYNSLVPGDYQGLAHTASCLSALGRFAEAEALFRQVLPHLDDATTHYNLGLLLARTGRGEDAEREYRAALDRDPSHADARINLATTLARAGNLATARLELRHVLADDPDNALARRNLDALR